MNEKTMKQKPSCTIGCHTSDFTWSEYDAQGIYLCRVCEDCVEHRLSGYRPEILSGYSQADVDEPIDPEPTVGGVW